MDLNILNNNASQGSCGETKAYPEANAEATSCGTESSQVMAETVEGATGPGVYLETFGCQMNVLDSQLVHSQLKGLGYRFVNEWQTADIVLYNTCSVRDHAEQKVYSAIGRIGKLKKKSGRNIVLGVIGCMAEREGVDLSMRYPQVDLMCGPGELDKVPQLIDNVFKTNEALRGNKTVLQHALQGNTHRRSSTLDAAKDELEMLDMSRSFSPDQYRGSAYVRITRGCNKFCTYCVVPNTRGAEVHRSPDAIIDECKKLVDAGVKEITLLGQTVNHYHFDHGAQVEVGGIIQPQIGTLINRQGIKAPKGVEASERDLTTFAQLMYRIHEEVSGLKRLRFITSFPRDFGDDILAVMRDCDRICNYLHMPVQTGSDRLLKLMNREHSVAEYDELIHRIRGFMPDATITSDLITGFPTETEEDHQLTIDLMKRSQWKNCFIFKYSPRPGTVAIKRFEDDIPEDLKKLRNNDLLDVQNQVSLGIHESYIGKTMPIFVESISTREKRSRNTADGSVSVGWESNEQILQLSGRTEGDLITMFNGSENHIGKIVDIKIERAACLSLFGKLV